MSTSDRPQPRLPDPFTPGKMMILPPDPPTAWLSLPAPVRFAVWVWAVMVIASTVAAVVGAVIWVVILFVTLGSM